MCESVGKADRLSDHFGSKQSRETVDLLLTCHQSPSLTTFAFRSREVRALLLDLDPIMKAKVQDRKPWITYYRHSFSVMFMHITSSVEHNEF